MDYEIQNVTKETNVSDGTRFLDVTVLFGKDIERKFAFSLEATPKDIEKELKAQATLLAQEAESAEADAEVDEAEVKGDKTIESLLGKK